MAIICFDGFDDIRCSYKKTPLEKLSIKMTLFFDIKCLSLPPNLHDTSEKSGCTLRGTEKQPLLMEGKITADSDK